MPESQKNTAGRQLALKRVGWLLVALALALVSSYLFSSGLAWAASSGSVSISTDPGAQDQANLLHSTKYALKPVVLPGGEAPYKIKLINTGTSPANVIVTDTIPAVLNYVAGSASHGGVYDENTRAVTWQTVTVPARGFVALSLVTTATTDIISPTWVVNTATFAAEGQTFDRWATLAILPRPAVPPRSILAGSHKFASQRFATLSDTVTYTVKLVNSGGVDALTSVVDQVPRPLEVVSDSISTGGVYDPISRTIAWDDVAVPAGGSIPLTFAVNATGAISHPVLVMNTAFISVTDGGQFRRHAPLLLVPQLPGDGRRPAVESVTIGEQDVLSSPATTLHISATDNVSVSQMYIREWQLTTAPVPRWMEVKSSGWITYEAHYPWSLSDQDGAHYVGVWVADANHNISKLGHAALDFASLVRPGAAVPEKGLVPYLVYYPENISVTASLTPAVGDADLYVWYPHSFFWPDQASTQPLTATESVSFTTPRAGTYLFLVHGYMTTTYDLSIVPGGGPRAAEGLYALDQAVLPAPGKVTDRPGGLTLEPVLSQSGLDPLATAPSLDEVGILYLPTILR